jgi:hypothetical protein
MKNEREIDTAIVGVALTIEEPRASKAERVTVFFISSFWLEGTEISEYDVW